MVDPRLRHLVRPSGTLSPYINMWSYHRRGSPIRWPPPVKSFYDDREGYYFCMVRPCPDAPKQ